MHQYSTAGGIDRNVLNGDRTTWAKLSGGTPQPTTPEDDDMPYGQLAEGPKAITPGSLPRGRYKTIGFIADNGLQGLPPAQLRVAVHHNSQWQVTSVTVDSTKGQSVVTFVDPGGSDGFSVRREDAGDVHVAWEVS
jgi:hypothetical protein